MRMEIITTDSDPHRKSSLYQKAAAVAVTTIEGDSHGTLPTDVIETIETMRTFYKACGDKSGFAAPQVGISQRIILVEKALYDSTSELPEGEPVILVNPEWKALDEKKELDIEGCLSVLGHMGIVNRYINVELTAWLYSLEKQTVSKITRQYRREFSCVLWQHEIDHLEGMVYTNHPEKKHVFTESDYMVFMNHLKTTEQLKEGMTLFDMGSLLNELVDEWQEQHPNHSAEEFVQTKSEIIEGVSDD